MNGLLQTCSDPALAHLLYYVKKFLNMIQLIGPLVAIVGLSIHIIRYISSPDSKKNKGLIKNWAIALFMLFLVPMIINLTMKLLDGSFDLPTCWNDAEEIAKSNDSNDNGYIELPEKNKKKKFS